VIVGSILLDKNSKGSTRSRIKAFDYRIRFKQGHGYWSDFVLDSSDSNGTTSAWKSSDGGFMDLDHGRRFFTLSRKDWINSDASNSSLNQVMIDESGSSSPDPIRAVVSASIVCSQDSLADCRLDFGLTADRLIPGVRSKAQTPLTLWTADKTALKAAISGDPSLSYSPKFTLQSSDLDLRCESARRVDLNETEPTGEAQKFADMHAQWEKKNAEMIAADQKAAQEAELAKAVQLSTKPVAPPVQPKKPRRVVVGGDQ
jgi:hypothetical protein